MNFHCFLLRTSLDLRTEAAHTSWHTRSQVTSTPGVTTATASWVTARQTNAWPRPWFRVPSLGRLLWKWPAGPTTRLAYPMREKFSPGARYPLSSSCLLTHFLILLLVYQLYRLTNYTRIKNLIKNKGTVLINWLSVSDCPSLQWSLTYFRTIAVKLEPVQRRINRHRENWRALSGVKRWNLVDS